MYKLTSYAAFNCSELLLYLLKFEGKGLRVWGLSAKYREGRK